MSDAPGNRLIAARYNSDGKVIAELVETRHVQGARHSTREDLSPAVVGAEYLPDSAVVRTTRNSREYFEWTTPRGHSQLKLIVAVDGIQRVRKDSRTAAIHLRNP